MDEQEPAPEHVHSRGRYVSGWKHCEGCRAEATAYIRAQRAVRAQRVVPAGTPHGDYAYKEYKCRCEICSTAHSDRMKAYREANAERLLAYDKNRREHKTT